MKLEWRMVPVELGSEKDPALLDALIELADQGFSPAFIVPVFSGFVQVLASRPRAASPLKPSSRPPPMRPRLPSQGTSWGQAVKIKTK